MLFCRLFFKSVILVFILSLSSFVFSFANLPNGCRTNWDLLLLLLLQNGVVYVLVIWWLAERRRPADEYHIVRGRGIAPCTWQFSIRLGICVIGGRGRHWRSVPGELKTDNETVLKTYQKTALNTCLETVYFWKKNRNSFENIEHYV